MSRRLSSKPSATEIAGPARIVISNSHRDERWLDLLERHLGVLAILGIAKIWSYRCIPAGKARDEEIFRAIDSSHLAIQLISPSFLASERIMKTELPRILNRHRAGELAVVGVLVQPCLWTAVPCLSEIQMRPRDYRPLSLRREWKEAEVAKITAEFLGIPMPGL